MRRCLVLVFVLCLLVGCGGGLKAGDTRVREIDGMTMVYVPAGEFLMGSTDDDPEAKDQEMPQHTVYLDAFWIDRTEVTNEQYQQCVDEGVCNPPVESPRGELEGYTAPDLPVSSVTWFEADAYCTWAGARLPTEAEWEKAASWDAQQEKKLPYPWGVEAPNRELANYVHYVGRPAPVGSYPAGDSPYGCADMAGNVWEWVADRFGPDYYGQSPSRNPLGPESGESRVLRGGSWYNRQGEIRPTSRDWNYPDSRINILGFRCGLAATSTP